MFFRNQLTAEDVGSFMFFLAKNTKNILYYCYSEQTEKETV